MSLLKTVLLSTTLMMGTAFGADADTTTAAATSHSVVAERSDAEVFADTLAAIRAENAQYLSMIKTLVFKIHSGDVTPTDRGEFLDHIQVLSRGLNAALRGNTQLQSDLAAATGRSEETAAANAQLIAEKAAAEAALKAAIEQLEAVTSAKDALDGQLAEASAKVTELGDALAAEKAAATGAGRDAARSIKELTTELAVAQAQLDDLTAKVDALSALTDTAERLKREKEAGLRAIEAIDAANKRGTMVNIAEYDPLAGAEDLPTGAEDDDVYDDLRGRFTGAFDDDSSAARSSLEDPIASVAAAQIADLKAKRSAAKDAITASPFTGKGSKKKNEDAQAEARAAFEDLTDKLEKLGVN